jgi:hypothetical protein
MADQVCPRCRLGLRWRGRFLCIACERAYCFNCGNDLPCPDHPALIGSKEAT